MLWAYQTSFKTTTFFSPFQLVHGVEAVFPIECEIPSLKIVVNILLDIMKLEEHVIYLEHLNDQC